MYRLKKTIEAASFLLSEVDDEMPYIKLIKLLYLADREMLRQRGRTITGDTFWAMKCGPVLEHTLDAIKNGDGEWDAFMETDDEAKMISLVSPPPIEALSDAEQRVLKEVTDKFGRMSWRDLVKFTHELPEWKKKAVTSGRKRIQLPEVLEELGFDDDQIEQIESLELERQVIARSLDALPREPLNV